MSLKYCQGPVCHTYHTKDRLKGIKGMKNKNVSREDKIKERLLYEKQQNQSVN